MTTEQDYHSIIAIENTVYYTKRQVIKTKEKTTHQFGESFTINFAEEDKSCNINYKNSTKVRVLARDLDFMLSFIKYGYFKINGIKFPFNKNGVDFSNFDIEKQKQHLAFAQKTVKVLDLLNCNKDIDLRELSIKDQRTLEYLITAFVDKQPVKNLKPNLPPIIKFNIGTLSFLLCPQACEKSKTTYNIYDFFKTEIPLAYDGKNKEKLSISQYFILQPDDLLTVNNIRFDVLLPSFQKAKKHYDTYNNANWFLLNLLIAFDKSGGKRTEILKTAHEFAAWTLHEANEDDLPSQVKTLNYLQVIKREREFNISELTELYSLTECSTTKEDTLVGTYLLLGQQQAAEIHFDKLTPKIQNDFKSYPIYHFWVKIGDGGNK